jgi:hypothetical protein
MKPQHWQQLDRIHNALSTFEVATMDAQGNSPHLHEWYPTISFMLNTIDEFKVEFAAEAQEDASFNYISQCCDHAWHKIEKYYKLCDQAPMLYAAVYLNPMFKAEWFKKQWANGTKEQQCWIQDVRKRVFDLWETEYKGKSFTDTTNTPFTPSRAVQLTGKEKEKDQNSVHNRMREYKRLKYTDNHIHDELEDYLSSDIVMDPQYASGAHDDTVPPFDCLAWWWARRNQWPYLSRMAFDSLAIPLMSDNPERSFSSGRDMITYRRSRLQGEIIEACALLRSTYGPPTKVIDGNIEKAFDKEEVVEADYETPVRSFSFTVGLSQSTEVDKIEEDLYGLSE